MVFKKLNIPWVPEVNSLAKFGSLCPDLTLISLIVA